jgi:hypothetical protein
MVVFSEKPLSRIAVYTSHAFSLKEEGDREFLREYVSYAPPLKMEAISSSETLETSYKTTLCYNPENHHQYVHYRESLKSQT